MSIEEFIETSRSKYKTYIGVIVELRNGGNTFAEISHQIEDEQGVKIHRSTIEELYKKFNGDTPEMRKMNRKDTICENSKKARELGMSYGQYIAMKDGYGRLR